MQLHQTTGKTPLRHAQQSRRPLDSRPATWQQHNDRLKRICTVIAHTNGASAALPLVPTSRLMRTRLPRTTCGPTEVVDGCGAQAKP